MDVKMLQSEWVEKVKNIVKSAYETIIKNKAFEVRDKGRQDIVTDLDIQMERRIKACLKELFPEDHFIGEEENHSLVAHQMAHQPEHAHQMAHQPEHAHHMAHQIGRAHV